jgi:hypothetical protein
MRMTGRYETSIDRAGLALGAGSLMLGLITLLLLLPDGSHGAAGPLWLVLHVAGLRGPVAAALAGAVLTVTLFVGAQTHGFGLFDQATTASGAALFRWVSALLTAGLLGVLAAGIAVAMWGIAYRRR